MLFAGADKLENGHFVALHTIGRRDDINPPEGARQVAAAVGGEIFDFEGGHDVPMDEAGAVRSDSGSFFKSSLSYYVWINWKIQKLMLSVSKNCWLFIQWLLAFALSELWLQSVDRDSHCGVVCRDSAWMVPTVWYLRLLLQLIISVNSCPTIDPYGPNL